MQRFRILLIAVLATGSSFCAAAADDNGAAAPAPEPVAPAAVPASPYTVQPGDVLTVTVWKETDLTGDVLVRPDGGLSFPLVGDLPAQGRTVDSLRQEITERLKHYIPDPVVTVATKAVPGNHVYVVGKVMKPGEFPLASVVDVMQALSLAGGATPFAAVNDIIILRRESGEQQAIRFRYNDVARGNELSQNILLKAGDTVVVP